MLLDMKYPMILYEEIDFMYKYSGMALQARDLATGNLKSLRILIERV